MSPGPLDPRIDMLVAALYGELSEEEWSRFERLLAEDRELRQEWEELQGTRRALASWEIEEAAPAFVLLEPKERVERSTSPGTWVARIRTLLTSPAQLGWAVAAAAVLLLVFSWLDFHVERDGGSVAFRFGTPEARFVDGAPAASGVSDAWVTDSLGTRIPLTGDFSPVSNESPYMTRDEFYAYSEGVARALGDLLRAADYNRAKNEEFSGYVRTLYSGLEDRQAESYYDLRTRIETIRYGLDQQSQESFLERYPGGESISPGVRSTPSQDDKRVEGGR